MKLYVEYINITDFNESAESHKDSI